MPASRKKPISKTAKPKKEVWAQQRVTTGEKAKWKRLADDAGISVTKLIELLMDYEEKNRVIRKRMKS